jgi:hypothetical protein
MSPELDKKLCEEFPEIFKDRYGDMQQTAMCWGFECGDGWYGIIRFLCRQLMRDYNRAKQAYDHCKVMLEKEDKSQWREWHHRTYTQEELAKRKEKLDSCVIPVAAQVKEKFGGLRFYLDRATDAQYDLVSMIGNLSYSVCEECGTTLDVHSFNMGWIRSLCVKHGKERYGEAEVEEYLTDIEDEKNER